MKREPLTGAADRRGMSARVLEEDEVETLTADQRAEAEAEEEKKK
jgi:hypothetical protein